MSGLVGRQFAVPEPGLDIDTLDCGFAGLTLAIAIVVTEHLDAGLTLFGQTLTREAPAAIHRIGSQAESEGQPGADPAMVVDPPLGAQGKAGELADIAQRIGLQIGLAIDFERSADVRSIIERGINHQLRAAKSRAAFTDAEFGLTAQMSAPDRRTADQRKRPAAIFAHGQVGIAVYRAVQQFNGQCRAADPERAVR